MLTSSVTSSAIRTNASRPASPLESLGHFLGSNSSALSPRVESRVRKMLVIETGVAIGLYALAILLHPHSGARSRVV